MKLTAAYARQLTNENLALTDMDTIFSILEDAIYLTTQQGKNSCFVTLESLNGFRVEQIQDATTELQNNGFVVGRADKGIEISW